MFQCIFALVNHTRSQYLKRTKHSVFMLPVIVWRLCCRINSLSDHSKRRLAKSTNGFCKPRLETPCTFRFLPIHIIEIALKIAILDKTKMSIYSYKMYYSRNRYYRHIKKYYHQSFTCIWAQWVGVFFVVEFCKATRIIWITLKSDITARACTNRWSCKQRKKSIDKIWLHVGGKI